jgi:hypothetical protein
MVLGYTSQSKCLRLNSPARLVQHNDVLALIDKEHSSPDADAIDYYMSLQRTRGDSMRKAEEPMPKHA